MSDNILRIIPAIPDFIACIETCNVVCNFLKQTLPNAGNISIQMNESIVFVDPGSEFIRVFCPNCSNEINIDWWQEEMDKANNSSFINLEIVTPCCMEATTLNDLLYETPAGFARLVSEVYNPNADVGDEIIKQVEHILGCPVRKIWAHY